MRINKKLLADCLREKEDAYIVGKLVEEFPSLREIVDVTEEELREIEGVGKVKAKQIRAIVELAKMISKPCFEENFTIKSPYDIYDYLIGDVQHLKQEHFIVVALNTKNNVLFKETVSIGSLDFSVAHPREVFRPLIKRAAFCCILSHNHPSGDPTPSIQDIEVTKRMVEAGELLGIKVLDHIVLGQGCYTSFKESGLI